MPEQPKGALGRGPEGTVVLDPETLEEKPPAEFDDNGRLLNPDECIGEIVNKNNAISFEGYYKNEEANAQRVRNGWYWSGDLGYRDKDGWFYFAGRDYEWLRVDGENFAAAPIERIVARYPGVILDAVYAVPDEEVGDQVMVALQVADPTAFDPAEFDEFLRQQTDLGTKWSPRYVRVATDSPDRDVEGHQAPTTGAAVAVRRPRLLPPEERPAPAPVDTSRRRRDSGTVRGARSLGRTRQGLSITDNYAPLVARLAIDRPRRAKCCGPPPNVFSSCFTHKK